MLSIQRLEWDFRRMIDLEYPKILDLFPEHIDPKRSESASFLIWYLKNYYRLDALEVVDSVCDNRGDKGVDGIFVNDNDQTITILQSRVRQAPNSAIGDAALREFAGTLSQFDSVESVQNLIVSAGNAQVATLTKRLDLANKVATHELRGEEFVSNVEIDGNGVAFLNTIPEISFVGRTTLETTYISDERDQPVHTPVSFDIGGFPVSEYIVDANTKAIIAPIKATELVTMHGIADQSIFMYNVRGPLGRTQVNKDIVKTIRNQAAHKMFPLFHNGITVIAGKLDATVDTVEAMDYFVVNGCQSLTSLFNSKAVLTDSLRVLVKFIQMDPRSDWAGMITQFSNNQNGVRPMDFKSNDKTQVKLQNEFEQYYHEMYSFEIKRGETLGGGEKISNEEAGLYLMAFDLKQPWATNRRYQVFEDRHADLFGRPEVTADRIVWCHVIVGAIEEKLPEIENKLFARYALTRYMLLYVMRQIIERDGLAERLLTRPAQFVRESGDRGRFRACVGRIVGDFVIDLNDEVKGYGEDFDYRDKLRDEEWVEKLSTTVAGDYQKLVTRGRIPSFEKEWEGGVV